jgi:hypothetical protein
MMSAANSGNSGRVVIAFRNGEEISAELDWHYDDGKYQVAAVGPWGRITGHAADAFSALVEVRRALEIEGWRLAVAGARRDTYPSGMARSSGGFRAYEMRPGRPASSTVDIFDDAPTELIGTVDEQEENFRLWWGSYR